jgi:DNA-binding NarL/FixJ family response regulator
VTIKVGVIDDNELVRIAVEEILNRASDIDVVGGFTGVGTLLESGQEVDVLLLGNGLSQAHSLAALAELKEKRPALRIIVLGRQWSETSIRAVLDCGAAGVADRDESLHDLLAAGVRRVFRGKQFLSPDVALAYTHSGGEGQLSERELDVVLLMDTTDGTKSIAAALGLNRRTIYRLQQSICEKWDLRSKDQIVAEAIRRGIIRR